MVSSDTSIQTAGVIQYGVAASPHPDESQSGDAYAVIPTPGGILVGVIDGLGHGAQAAQAAATAVATLQRYAGESVIALIRRCHEAEKSTRGAVMSLADFNARDHTMTWISVGNVDGLLLHPDSHSTSSHECVVMRGGVVGDNLPVLHAEVLPVSPGDVLIFVTDGIKRGFEQGLSITASPRFSLTAPPQEIANQICTHWNKGTDDALAFVARYRGDL